MCRRVVGEGVRVGWYQVLLVGGEGGYDGGVLGCKRGVINGCQFFIPDFFYSPHISDFIQLWEIPYNTSNIKNDQIIGIWKITVKIV